MYESVTNNPTSTIDVGWDAYVATRRSNTEAHLVGGVPDYSFALDNNLRQKLRAMPGFERLAHAYFSVYLPRYKQEENLKSLKVGPTQLPEVYEAAVECARMLGIGIPDVYVRNDVEMNAFTYAMDDNSPIIVIHSGILERTTPGELKAVIGHECGHIANNHSLYESLSMMIASLGLGLIPGLQQIVTLLSASLKLAFASWSRAAEVTADRAGVICSDNFDDNITVQAKLMSGAMFGQHDYDVDAILRQYDSMRETPVRFNELLDSHPANVRRIIAEREFLNSEVLYSWRPEWRKPGMSLITKDELDERCSKYIGVFKSEKRGGAR